MITTKDDTDVSPRFLTRLLKQKPVAGTGNWGLWDDIPSTPPPFLPRRAQLQSTCRRNVS